MLILRTKIIFITLFVIFAVSGCGGNNDDTAAKSATVPKAIKDVDDALAKPFDEYFKDIQGDYAVARQITGKVQIVIDKSDRMSMPHIMGLLETAGTLEKNPTEENYSALVNEWGKVRSKIKLKKE